MKQSILLFLSIFIFSILFVNTVYAEEVKVGTYEISSAGNNDLLLVSKNNNVELGNKSSSGEKLWDIYSNNNYFYIKSHSNNELFLELSNEKSISGANVQLSTAKNTNAQKWKLNVTGSYYYITSVIGNFNVDVTYGYFRDGMNIQMFQNNGRDAQKWILNRIDEKEQTIENGTYIFRALNNNDNVIDLKGANTNNRTNIWMYSNNNTWAQIWNLKYENGFYTISSIMDSNKLIDIASAKFANYTNVHLFENNNTNAQKFLIEKNVDNTYTIKTYDGLWALDIKSASTKKEANIHLYQVNNTIAQKFYFEKVNISDIETGYYNIESILGDNRIIGVSNKALSNFKNVELTENTDFNYTKWYIEKLEKDIYKIANADNKKMVIDVYGNRVENRTNIQLYTSNNTDAQKWIIRKNQDGTYKFIGKGSNKVIDVSSARSDVGTNIQLFEENNTDAQRFRIIPTQVSEYTKEYDDGQYNIKHSNGKMLDISGASKANGTNVQLYQSNDNKAQIWKITYDGDGVYIIKSMINPKLVLTASSDNVISSRNTNNDLQKWYFDKQDDTTYILNKATGKYLSLDGTNIVLTTNKVDKFSLIAYNKKIPYRGMDVSNHQGDINWSKVATSNIDFVVIRAGYAEEKIVDGVDQYEDRRFVKNVQECEKYNIPYSLYLYSYANYVTGNYDSATLEANHMLNLFKKIKNKGYYPPMNTAVYFDQEDESIKNLSKATLTAMINEFCGKMNNNGHKCGVYANMNWLNNKINVSQVVNRHTIWVAQWPGYNTFDRALASQSSYTTTPHELWQFTSDGSISGISGRVDLDIGYDIFK